MRNSRMRDEAVRAGLRGPERGMAALRDLLGQTGGSARADRRDVRAAVLALLAEQPMHGYQLIGEIAARSEGAWRPGAGSVYPTLQMLTDEGLVTGDAVGERKSYALTEAGREAAASQGASPWVSPSEARTGERASALPRASLRLGKALTQFGPDASPEQIRRAVDVVEEARRKLYTILAEG